MPMRRCLLGLLPWAATPWGEAAHGAAAAEPLDLDRLMAGLAAVPERRATFEEARRFAALEQPLLSIGRLRYRRPGFLEKTTDWPQPESLVVDGDRLILTIGNEPPRVVDLGGQPELRTLIEAIRGPLSGDLAALRRAFTVVASGTAEDWTLVLTPIDPRAGRLLRRAQVSGRLADVAVVALVQANGDEQRMTMRPTP